MPDGEALSARDQKKLAKLTEGKPLYDGILECLRAQVDRGNSCDEPGPFICYLKTLFKEWNLDVDAKLIAKIAKGLSTPDPTAKIQRDKHGDIIYDTDLKDTEIVPCKESIDDYMVREVLPHLPGAKAFFLEDLKAKKPIIKTGAKYKFNSYFYRYEDLGRSEKLALQLVDCERNISSSIDSLWKGLKDETYCAVTKGIGGQARLCDSGILWIGRMPHNWSVDVLGSFVSQVKCKNVGLKEKNLLSLSHGSIKQKDINTSKGLLPESFDGYNIISRNDIVLRITDLQNDRKSIRVGQACESGIITSAYVTVRPNKKIDPGYLHYVILAFDLVKGFYGMGEGVRQSLTFDDIKKIKIPVPPIKEQRAIAASLNEKWAVIDFIAEKYREQLNNLESLKRAMVFDYAAGRKLSEEVPQ